LVTRFWLEMMARDGGVSIRVVPLESVAENILVSDDAGAAVDGGLFVAGFAMASLVGDDSNGR